MHASPPLGSSIRILKWIPTVVPMLAFIVFLSLAVASTADPEFEVFQLNVTHECVCAPDHIRQRDPQEIAKDMAVWDIFLEELARSNEDATAARAKLMQGIAENDALIEELVNRQEAEDRQHQERWEAREAQERERERERREAEAQERTRKANRTYAEVGYDMFKKSCYFVLTSIFTVTHAICEIFYARYWFLQVLGMGLVAVVIIAMLVGIAEWMILHIQRCWGRLCRRFQTEAGDSWTPWKPYTKGQLIPL
jgi:hypothetical protein